MILCLAVLQKFGNILAEKTTLEKYDEENYRMYKSRILKGKNEQNLLLTLMLLTRCIEYSKFKVNFPKILENTKSLEKQNRPAKDEILSTFSRHRWTKIATKDQFQHSIRGCSQSQCLKSDELRKVLPKFFSKNVYLKNKEQGTVDFTKLTNLAVTTLDHSFNAAFNISFSKCSGINKNDRCNKKKLAKPFKACAIKRETATLVKQGTENHWAKNVVERYLHYSNYFF